MNLSKLESFVWDSQTESKLSSNWTLEMDNKEKKKKNSHSYDTNNHD